MKTSAGLAIGALIAAIFGLIIGLSVMSYNNVSTETVIVDSKERITTGSGEDTSSKYVVFTDKGTFEITDSLLMFRFNSSDIYGSVKADTCYDLVLRGFRIPFLSIYQNIDTLSPCK